MSKLDDYTTSELTEELLKREAVSSVKVEPYEVYEIKVNNTLVKDVGPAILIVNMD